jgi:hypothetical protein
MTVEWRGVGRAGGIRWRSVLPTVAIFSLPVWFAVHDVLIFANIISHDFLFIDVRVYREAAATVLGGGDPWAPTSVGVAFAGPPPTLLPFIPLALVPLELAVVITATVLGSAAWWAIRRLGLAPWWMLFPPLFEGLVVGNLDVAVVALLLIPGPLAGLAAVAKIYGVVPLLLQRRWAAIGLAIAISALTLPLWPTFIRHLPEIRETLDLQSGGYSAWGTWFMVPTVMALWALRRRGASWLVVPALWPDTQIHYSAMSLPAISRFPLAAAIIGLASPLSAPIAVVVMAVQARWWPPSEMDATK